MKDWFGKLQRREQQFIFAGATALGILLLYALLWSPFSGSIDKLHKRVISLEQTLQWMQSAANEIGVQGKPRTHLPAGTRSLLTLVSETSKSSGLGASMKRIEEDGPSRTRVILEQADFDKLILWLGALQNDHGVIPNQVTIDRKNVNGLVNARMVLEKQQ